MTGAAARARRVLYVDDDVGLGRLVQRDLGRHGYAVVVALGGAEAVRLAAGGGFDAVCLDHHMPGQDGLATLAGLRALPAVPPIVYVTGSDDGRIAVAALGAGAAGYVIKEVGGEFLALLRAALAGAIEREDLRRENERALREMQDARERAERLASERALLLREVNHRVANSLQLIASLTQLQEAAVQDPAARGALAEVRNRVFAVAQVHRRLYTSGDVHEVALDDYLGGLLEEIERSMDATARGFRLELSAARVAIATDRAVSLGVIVAELVTNAFKYAYPGGGGAIRVRLAQEDGQCVSLLVEDDGSGLPLGPGASAHKAGIGHRIVTALASRIGGTVETLPRTGGVAVAVRFPIEG